MAFTNGSIFGKFEGSSSSNNSIAANNSSNAGNPNQAPANDLFQIIAPGGKCLLQVTAAYAVNTNVANTSDNCQIAQFQMTTNQFTPLAASPTAAQICQAAFPLNYANQQLDLIQIEADTTAGPVGISGGALGGGYVVWRLKFDGSTATS